MLKRFPYWQRLDPLVFNNVELMKWLNGSMLSEDSNWEEKRSCSNSSSLSILLHEYGVKNSSHAEPT